MILIIAFILYNQKQLPFNNLNISYLQCLIIILAIYKRQKTLFLLRIKIVLKPILM